MNKQENKKILCPNEMINPVEQNETAGEEDDTAEKQKNSVGKRKNLTGKLFDRPYIQIFSNFFTQR